MSKLTYERAKQLYTPYDEGQMRHLCALRDVEIDRLLAENAKLRRLVLHMVECVRRLDGTSEDGGCSLCPYQSIDYDCEFENRARDLGVEVDDVG